MKNKEVTILDFGSRKITCMAGEKTFDDDFVIKATGQSLYNGFDDGVFFEPEKLSECVSFAIKQVEDKLGKRIKSLYVGVPGEFSVVSTSEGSTVFHSKKKIDDNDLKELSAKADIFTDVGNRIKIESSSIFFVCDNLEKSYNPTGLVAQKLSGFYSFVFADKYFCNFCDSILKKLGIYDVTYLNVCSAEALFLAKQNNKNGKAIIFDVGHITSNVMVSEGNGLIFQYTFPLGSGYIASDLMQVLNISFDRAMQLLNKINLNLEFAENDSYTLSDGVLVQAELSNNVVKARISQIADYIKRSFSRCDKEIDRDTPVLLTGGGLCYLKGADNFLTSCLNKPISVVESDNGQHNKNEYSSSYGLLAKALSMPAKSFWGK